VVFRCKVKERDKVVISNAAVELYTEVPKKKAKAAKARAAARRLGGAGPTSGLVFEAIGAYLTKNPDVAAKVGGLPVQAERAPTAQWTLDLKLNKVARERPRCPSARSSSATRTSWPWPRARPTR
jgi:3-hydroxyacyl-CoA dehydrogenase/3a,7a,12a-trihydroxy-5b-cholest-24-enoyl-CoA hydratase